MHGNTINMRQHKMMSTYILTAHNINGWPITNVEVGLKIHLYWTFCHYLAVIDGTELKGRRTVTPASLQQQAWEQIQGNHMGIDKTSLFAWESIYWLNFNDNIEKTTQNC